MSDTSNTVPDEVARLQAIIERDRSAFCSLLVRLKTVAKSRVLLCEGRAANGYAYDEDGYVEEFTQAYNEIMSALDTAHAKFRSFDDSPKDNGAVASAQLEAVKLLNTDVERAPLDIDSTEAYWRTVHALTGVMHFRPLMEDEQKELHNAHVSIREAYTKIGVPRNEKLIAMIGVLRDELHQRRFPDAWESWRSVGVEAIDEAYRLATEPPQRQFPVAWEYRFRYDGTDGVNGSWTDWGEWTRCSEEYYRLLAAGKYPRNGSEAQTRALCIISDDVGKKDDPAFQASTMRAALRSILAVSRRYDTPSHNTISDAVKIAFKEIGTSP